MKFDTKITLIFALIYFLNGLFNLFGASKAYMPFFFLDYFLLSLLAICFLLLKPFHILNFSFVVFSAIYCCIGLISFPNFKNDNFELFLLVALFLLNSIGYIFLFIAMLKDTKIVLLMLLLFILIFVFGFLHLPGIYSVITSAFLLLLQVLLLSLPDKVQNLNSVLKRFILLNSLFIAFEINRYIFLYLYS